MDTLEKQEQSLTFSWLVAKGYTIAAAARRIGRNHNHVRLVLKGERRSKKTEAALVALPFRPFIGRERITH